LRLYPELIVYCIVLVTVCVFEGWRIYMVQLAGAVLYFSNYLQAFFQIPSPVNFEMRPLWSLAVEEHFYLIFPFLVIMSRGNVRLLLMGLFFGFVGMFVWRHIARHVIGLPGPYLEYATECRADAIIAGCLFALMLSSSKGKDLLEYLDDNGGLILSSAVALLLFSIVVRHEEFRAVARWTVQSIGAALLVASCAFGGQIRRLRSWLASAPMRFFGRISYSVYLYHLLIFKLVKTHLGHDWRFFPINIGASVVVASLSYLLIEDPLKPLRRRFGSNVRSVRSTSDVPVKAVPQSTIDRGVPIGAAEPDQLPAG
jgi:peptidoglycan/LPS O-acetylase OafA/YrhL